MPLHRLPTSRSQGPFQVHSPSTIMQESATGSPDGSHPEVACRNCSFAIRTWLRSSSNQHRLALVVRTRRGSCQSFSNSGQWVLRCISVNICSLSARGILTGKRAWALLASGLNRVASTIAVSPGSLLKVMYPALSLREALMVTVPRRFLRVRVVPLARPVSEAC